MRTFLAILTACAAFAASLAVLFPFEEIFTHGEDEAFDAVYIAVFLPFVLGFLALFWVVIAGGILVAPKTGLRSHVLDRIRGGASPASRGWFQAALAGLAASLLAAFASAAVRSHWPGSFTEETFWRDFAIKDALDLAAAQIGGAIVIWVGVLNLCAWACLKAFGAERRMRALAVAIVFSELLTFGLLAALTVLFDEPLSPATYAEAAAWSILSVTGAWLYVTRALEHGLLAQMWAPVVILVFRPLWAHLGI